MVRFARLLRLLESLGLACLLNGDAQYSKEKLRNQVPAKRGEADLEGRKAVGED